jgi:hypothetical protein
MLESLLVGLIVGIATVYAAWALTPAATRNRLAVRAAAKLEQRGSGGPAAWAAARLRSLARVPVGSCDSCSSHAATPAERASRQARDGR